MTDFVATPSAGFDDAPQGDAEALRRAIADHLRYSVGRPAAALRPEHYYRALALAVRDRMQDNRAASTQTSLDLGRKVTCYLSAEFLMGPQLGNNLLSLQLEAAARQALAAWATAALAGSPPATSTRWPPSSAPPSATASATNSASSTRTSATAGRSSAPTTGWPTATRGRSRNRM
jgi:starch phosphorylase